MQNNFVWKDGFVTINDFKNQTEETQYVTYYFKNSYMFKQFGGLNLKLAEDAEKQLDKNPKANVKFWYIPHAWTHGVYYMNDFDLDFGMAFYNDTWLMQGQQQHILENIKCETIYLKANTTYGADGVVYAANDDAGADKVTNTIENCTRLNIDSGHDIHQEHPDFFVEAFTTLRNNIGL